MLTTESKVLLLFLPQSKVRRLFLPSIIQKRFQSTSAILTLLHKVILSVILAFCVSDGLLCVRSWWLNCTGGRQFLWTVCLHVLFIAVWVRNFQLNPAYNVHISSIILACMAHIWERKKTWRVLIRKCESTHCLIDCPCLFVDNIRYNLDKLSYGRWFNLRLHS